MQSTLVERLRSSVTQCRALDRSQLLEEAAAEIERLRSQPCPYVTGTVTRYCTLTPFTLTDAEREAIHWFSDHGRSPQHAATLRGLLERLGVTESMTKEKRA